MTRFKVAAQFWAKVIDSSLRAQRSNPGLLQVRDTESEEPLDCFVAALLAMMRFKVAAQFWAK